MQISEAESVVMEVLWQRSPQTSEEVVAALGQRQEWQEATIKTLLNPSLKLVQKSPRPCLPTYS